ncbi:hypothetical protein ACIPVB_09130 [Microbacterium sp. NPDC090007]|uniref:hypothetical protein n=1 Tax=Microbacterium sp. NPDC090007 TaxID=3364204 RepID=UPI003813D6B4
MRVAPIREWPGTLTTDRQPSKFSASLTDTLRVLDREIWHLTETRSQQDSAELLIAIEPGQFRQDGRPYANAKAAHPGVIFSIDSRHGHLSYPCDTFTRWEDNLRAIALALEALRKVDRYGVTKRGEQYRGFLALEATAAPAGFGSPGHALAFLGTFIGLGLDEMRVVEGAALRALRRAQRETHPDAGGDAATFQRVSLAEAKLREAGLL